MLKLDSTQSNKPFTGVHGTVVSTSNNSIVKGDRSYVSTTVAKTIHVLMSNGIQKSVDVSESEISFVEGNKIFIVVADDRHLVYVKNFASNEVEIAKLNATTLGNLAFIGVIIGLYIMFMENFMNGLFISLGSGLVMLFFGWLAINNINAANRKLSAVFIEHSFDAGGLKLS